MKSQMIYCLVFFNLIFISNALAQQSDKPEFKKGKTSYFRYYAKKVEYQKEKDYCQIKFGDNFRQVGAQSEAMCDNPKSKTCAFSCLAEKQFELSGDLLKKVNSEFEKFEKENQTKIPSERLRDFELDSAFTERGISIVKSGNFISCPSGTKISGKFYGRINNNPKNPLSSGELYCSSESIPMAQICPDKGKRVQNTDGQWICGTNSCSGKIVYDNERGHYICVDCPKGKPDFDESLSWRNSNDFPEKCQAYSKGPACILCRVD